MNLAFKIRGWSWDAGVERLRDKGVPLCEGFCVRCRRPVRKGGTVVGQAGGGGTWE